MPQQASWPADKTNKPCFLRPGGKQVAQVKNNTYHISLLNRADKNLAGFDNPQKRLNLYAWAENYSLTICTNI
jgi:hypothetical protein